MCYNWKPRSHDRLSIVYGLPSTQSTVYTLHFVYTIYTSTFWNLSHWKRLECVIGWNLGSVDILIKNILKFQAFQASRTVFHISIEIGYKNAGNLHSMPGIVIYVNVYAYLYYLKSTLGLWSNKLHSLKVLI